VQTFKPTILFVGDVLLSRKVEFFMKSEGILYPFNSIKTLFENREAVVINFEAAVPLLHKPTPYFTTQFSVATSMLAVLAEVGITHASLANNHTEDFGRTGYYNTIAELERSDIITFGDPSTISSSSMTIISLGKFNIGIIGIHAVFSQPDVSALKLQLAELSKITDVQIAYIHWGPEYQLTHSRTQEELAVKLTSAGVDAIIGHHPHVTQDIQMVSGIPVFYSLGNFIFDQYFSTAVQEGYALELSMNDTVLEFSIIPVSSIKKQTQPQVMDETTKRTFLVNLAARSHPDLYKDIKRGMLIVPLRLATSSKTSIISQ